MKTIHAVTLGCVAAVALGFASSLSAQSSSFDHLECYEIKDTLDRSTATTDVIPDVPPFVAALGCKIRLPAREYCTRSAKENLQPPPAATVGGAEPGDYFCYRLACPRDSDLHRAPLESGDQFGRRTVLLRRPRRLCVPATRATPTPTPTVTPTGATPTATPGGHDPGCSFDGTECQGFCNTANRCLWEPNQQRCVCPPVFDADCDHAIVSCGGGLCYGPGQVCQPNPQATAQLCGCIAPTATPRPCNNALFPQCGSGDCGPISHCFNFGSFCGCEPPTPTPAATP